MPRQIVNINTVECGPRKKILVPKNLALIRFMCLRNVMTQISINLRISHQSFSIAFY